MRIPSYDKDELEREIGPRGATTINSANRSLVQNWLCAQGFASAWVKPRRVATLTKMYNSNRYLSKMIALRDSGELYSGHDTETDEAPFGAGDAGVVVIPAAPGTVVTYEEVAEHVAKQGVTMDTFRAALGDRGHGELILTPRTGPSPDMTITIDPAHAAAAHDAQERAQDMKLQAASEALKAASTLAQTYEALLERITSLEGRGGAPVAVSVATHGTGLIPGTELVRAADVFDGIGGDMLVSRFTERTEYAPEIDPSYCFDPQTTLAILLGFAHNRRVLISGRHGTGKSSHIEQVAARLNWPFFRLNLDGHLSRTDLIGRDAIVLKDEKQVTEFREGLLPWAMQQPIALCLDEYDAGRPDVLFVVQRLLESSGKLTIAEQNRVVDPNLGFRIFGTANTIGLGDASGLYHGTNAINAAQMDRWSITVKLDYLPESHEIAIVMGKVPTLGNKIAKAMVRTAAATRALFAANKISTVMSPRTVITWAENAKLLGGDIESAFKFTFANKCDEGEMSHIDTCYRESFAEA